MKITFIAFMFATLCAADAAHSQINLDYGRSIQIGDRVRLRDVQSGKWLSWYKGNWVVVTDKPKGRETTWTVSKLEKRDGKYETNHSFRLTNMHSNSVMDGHNDNSVVLDTNRNSDWYTLTDGKLPFNMYNSLEDARAGGLCYSIYNRNFGGRYYQGAQTDNDVVLRQDRNHLFQRRDDAPKLYFQFIKAN